MVRRIVGYRRFEGTEAAATLTQLYRSARLFVNFIRPPFKLATKTRAGARIKKTYHPPATPCQLLLADARMPTAVRRRVRALRATPDPVQLLSQMRAAQQRLVEIADKLIVGHPGDTVLGGSCSTACSQPTRTSTQSGNCGRCSTGWCQDTAQQMIFPITPKQRLSISGHDQPRDRQHVDRVRRHREMPGYGYGDVAKWVFRASGGE